MNITATIDLVELLVVFIGIVGFTISLVMLAIIQGDRRNVRLSGMNGINKRMTNSDLRNELSRTYKLACFVAIGVMSMLVPPPIREGNRLVGEILKWMLVSWEMVAVINSLWAYVDRQRNIESIRALEKASDEHDEERHAPRDSERDAGRDITRDVDRDTLRDVKRDVDRDIERDKLVEEEAS